MNKRPSHPAIVTYDPRTGWTCTVDGRTSRHHHSADAFNAAGWRTEVATAAAELDRRDAEFFAKVTVTLKSREPARGVWQVNICNDDWLAFRSLPAAIVELATHKALNRRIAVADCAARDISAYRLRPEDITSASAEDLRAIAASLANGDNPHLRSPTP